MPTGYLNNNPHLPSNKLYKPSTNLPAELHRNNVVVLSMQDEDGACDFGDVCITFKFSINALQGLHKGPFKVWQIMEELWTQNAA